MKSEENTNPITPVYLRDRTGKTQMQLAVDLQKTVGTISNWERGAKLPIFDTPEEVEAAIIAYQCSFSEFAEAFKDAQIRLTLSQLKVFLDRAELTFDDWKRMVN
ncbi:helix-turn-helix domain-containing protein [Trichocoleus sp. DQ-A3]|uniref:helix-turn-helix domain-containing protein n=1 Tax=Cyanophyceae TaxID=3028117 RepID=UPI001686205C|nr:helix-turn-helix transcriptional regulator [Coleofasciculus sp. FACHB-125]MBD1899247.1 helix-turn-helix transcriptional regulator [Coleofasciculus sp. FACHB-125]